MQIVEIPLSKLIEAPWNPNRLDPGMLARLKESISRFSLVQNLVVRPLGDGSYEVLSGNQRLQVLRDHECQRAPCVVVELDDARARLLAQTLNRVHGEDDLGLRAAAIQRVLEELGSEEVLSLLPESAESLGSLASLGQEDIADYLQAWQQAQQARLKHLQIQLTAVQMEVVKEVLSRLLPMAREAGSDSPNSRGTALYLLCLNYLEREVTKP